MNRLDITMEEAKNGLEQLNKKIEKTKMSLGMDKSLALPAYVDGVDVKTDSSEEEKPKKKVVKKKGRKIKSIVENDFDEVEEKVSNSKKDLIQRVSSRSSHRSSHRYSNRFSNRFSLRNSRKSRLTFYSIQDDTYFEAGGWTTSLLILIISGSCLLYSIFAFGNPDHQQARIDCTVIPSEISKKCQNTGG